MSKSVKNILITSAILIFAYWQFIYKKDDLGLNSESISQKNIDENSELESAGKALNEFSNKPEAQDLNVEPKEKLEKSINQDLPDDLKAQLNAPPPELPDDLKRQLELPPQELPEDLKAQLKAPPPELPDDIKESLKQPPRIVTLEEVNGVNTNNLENEQP